MFSALEANLIPLFEQLYRSIGYVGVVIAMAIESACIPLPSEIILPMAGWMVSRGIFTLWGATIAGVVGCVVGFPLWGSLNNYLLLDVLTCLGIDFVQ